MGIRLDFLPNFPGATFIPDSRVGPYIMGYTNLYIICSHCKPLPCTDYRDLPV